MRPHSRPLLLRRVLFFVRDRLPPLRRSCLSLRLAMLPTRRHQPLGTCPIVAHSTSPRTQATQPLLKQIAALSTQQQLQQQVTPTLLGNAARAWTTARPRSIASLPCYL